jgi:hypothetical protein
MRKSIAAVLVAVLSLALAGVALATFTQTGNITLTGHKAFKTTGIKASVSSNDTSKPQPKAAKLLVVTFPSGTKFNLSTPLVKACKLSDSQLKSGSKCPAQSKIGSGSALVNPYPLTPLPASVTSYVASSKTMVMVASANLPGLKPTVIRATVSGSKLTIPVPTESISGIKAVVQKLSLSVPAKGTGSKALITAGKCTSKKFLVKWRFTYVDGTTFSGTSSSACS